MTSRRVAPVTRLFVANRGEIAVRIIRACRSLGVETVIGVSAADRQSLAARLADRAVCVGPAPSGQSYLCAPVLVHAAKATGCTALHPGYGFLSERAELPEACEEEGIVFVGPRADLIRDLGDKVRARELAEKAGLPVSRGSAPTLNADEAARLAGDVGFPLLLKAVAGGGGRGMQLIRAPEELTARFDTASTEAREAFGDGRLYLEHYVERARHVEVQLMADRHGRVAHLGERDCSIQRRHQKMIEEAPAADVPAAVRAEMTEAAVAFGEAVGYDDVGTVELLYDLDRERYSFLEMNTRVQVEHPVSEMVTGADIVATQIRVAAGERLPELSVAPSGHAIECRITAESGPQGFLPVPGRITGWEPPSGEGIRLDSHCFAGADVPPYYDSLLAKLIVHGRDRRHAADRMAAALSRFEVKGVPTTIDVHQFILGHPDYRAGRVTTRWAEETALPAYLKARAAQ